MTDAATKKTGFHPHVTLQMEQARKSQAQKFFKKIENNQEAMKIFIDKLKQEDCLEMNTTRLKQIASQEINYLNKKKLKIETSIDENSTADGLFSDYSKNFGQTSRQSLNRLPFITSVKTARNDSSKVSSLSSRRLLQNEYYNRYISGQARGGPGRLGTASLVSQSQNFADAKSDFIPFDSISKPSLEVRKNQYLRKLDDDYLKTDAKLQARLGVRMQDGQFISAERKQFDPQATLTQKRATIGDTSSKGFTGANSLTGSREEFFSPNEARRNTATGKGKEILQVNNLVSASSSGRDIFSQRRFQIQEELHQKKQKVGKDPVSSDLSNRRDKYMKIDTPKGIQAQAAIPDFAKVTSGQLLQSPILKDIKQADVKPQLNLVPQISLMQNSAKGSPKNSQTNTQIEFKSARPAVRRVTTKSKNPVIQELDIEHQIIKMISSFEVYAHKNWRSEGDNPALKPCVEKTFKLISSIGEDKDAPSQQIHNMRLTRVKLKKYLSKRYNNRYAAKICALFDWSLTTLDYNAFYRQLDQTIINSGITPQKMDFLDHIITLKQTAFTIYDMNCDNAICEYDLFSIIRHCDNELFIQSVNQDIKDIRQKISQKVQDQIYSQQKKAFNEEDCEIRDLPKWLHDREVKKTIQSTFLKVFTSPKHYPYPGKKLFDDGGTFSSAIQIEPTKSLDIKYEASQSASSPFSQKQKNKDAFMKASQPISQPIQEMQKQGTGGGDSQARRNSLAHLCSKTDQMYHRKDQKKVKMEEFAVDVQFKYGIPMIVFDLIHALTGHDIISLVKKEFESKGHIQRMNPDNEQFQQAKQNIVDEFQDMAFSIFDDLGELDLKAIQQEINLKMLAEFNKSQEDMSQKAKDSEPNFNPYNMPMRDKERIQFITFDSIKRGFPKIFRKPNDAIAEILFIYASECTVENIRTTRINYHQFLNKFSIFWPQKVEVKEGVSRKNDSANAQEAYYAKLKEAEKLNKLVFNMFDRDRDGILSILDLNWLAQNFDTKCKLGQGIADIITLYMDKNVRPKYVKQKTIIDYQTFMSLMANCDLIKDLQYAFYQRLLDLQEEKEQQIFVKQKTELKKKKQGDPKAKQVSLNKDSDDESSQNGKKPKYQYSWFEPEQTKK